MADSHTPRLLFQYVLLIADVDLFAHDPQLADRKTNELQPGSSLTSVSVRLDILSKSFRQGS